jgi:hypothetical protein
MVDDVWRSICGVSSSCEVQTMPNKWLTTDKSLKCSLAVAAAIIVQDTSPKTKTGHLPRASRCGAASTHLGWQARLETEMLQQGPFSSAS